LAKQYTSDTLLDLTIYFLLFVEIEFLSKCSALSNF